ncbi:Plasma kallikrein [Pseudolycoriella hygida]|uniref:Plasma kallikrein n=1 Tax=Pseudolycoriella hygida TaxID=35572 RepID=A0A9Q0RUH1_9DIPT|nr:Plasma kallikrein [Pseudolycoriella hygida]
MRQHSTIEMKFLVFSIISMTLVASQEECGQRKSANPLVFGGTAVTAGDFPWVVPLIRKFNDKFFCGSNLISRQHVLTAAHCIVGKGSTTPFTVDDIYAYIGRFDLTANEETSRKSDIKQIIIHPNWSTNDIRYDADISILMLKNRVEFTDNIQPICLPSPTDQVFKIKGTVVGYGKSELGGLHENIPRRVEIASYTNDDCFFSDYQFARIASPRTFCAGERGKTPCQGDSGSGFYIDVRSSWKILGIVSSTTVQECGSNDFVLFTNVAKYTDWILSEMIKSNDKDELESIFNEFDENPNELESPVERKTVVDTECKYQESSSAYACYINGLTVPDEEIQLKIQGGDHKPRRTNRDVTAMQMVSGKVEHFPDLSDVIQTFPNMNGFGIAFAKLRHIDRSKMKGLDQFRFLLISDNEIEVIPPDTFMDLKELELIDICRNKIKSLEPDWISTMPKLRVFKARSNFFKYVPADMFKANPQLEEILFDYNQLQRIDVDFSELKSLKNLRILSNTCIDKAYCHDNNPKCMKSLQQFSLLVSGLCGHFP